MAEGGIGFSRKKKKKEKLVSEKIEGRGFRKTEKQPWFALLHFSKSNDRYLYAVLEKLDFHTSGKLNLSSVTNGFKRDREVLQRTT